MMIVGVYNCWLLLLETSTPTWLSGKATPSLTFTMRLYRGKPCSNTPPVAVPGCVMLRAHLPASSPLPWLPAEHRCASPV